MPKPQCPLCFTELIKKTVTPCMECGGDEIELDHYQEHTYREFEAYFKQKLILCDFCDVDFGSYNPAHFGFKKGKKINYTDFNFVKEITDKSLRLDAFCPSCNHSLGFLNFISICRSENKNSTT